MKTKADLKDLLKRIDGKGYPLYKQLKGQWSFDTYTLKIDHVQGDAFAMPSKMRIFIDHKVISTPKELLSSPARKVALCDYLTRRFHKEAAKKSRIIGTGKGGLVTIDAPYQQILHKTSCLIHEDFVELRFVVGLPADGRRVRGFDAYEILAENLYEVVSHALYFDGIDFSHVKNHVEAYEDADYLRSLLEEKNLVAFVANGSVLARASGISDKPLAQAVPFQSPKDMEVTLERPNLGPITGMGVKKGVSLIIGGGYHGKSTLLRAIERGVYNHIPGDGREWVITEGSACKIRAEDGRSVTGVTISPFINNLPGGRPTEGFSTENASGSTSQAANIMEALEAKAKVLLLDEDTCATNFMIRDRRMQALVAKECEPITPFVDRIKQISSDLSVSVILVMGGSGDYFESSDAVIVMREYLPENVTQRAKEVAQSLQTGRQNEGQGPLVLGEERVPLRGSFSGQKGRRELHIRCRKTEELTYGEDHIDTYFVEQLVHESQLRGIGYGLRWLEKRLQEGQSLPALLEELQKDIDSKGLFALCDLPDGDLAAFRHQEIAACINRSRRLKIRG